MKLYQTEIKNIKPYGQTAQFLKLQKEGLTGNIEKAGYPFNSIGWDNPKSKFDSDEEKKYVWTSYEQTAYALDGAVKCAILLCDKDWIDKLSKKIYKALDIVDKDGYIGAVELKEPCEINRWPHVVFFRAVLALYEYNKDKTIIDKLCNHYLGSAVDFSYARNALNIEIMLLLYKETNNKKLLDLAVETFEKFDGNEKDSFSTKNLKSQKKSSSHGVSYNEFSKLGVMLHMATGNVEYLKPAINGYKKVKKYQMLPDGLHSCNENMSDNGYMQTHELCNVTDMTWTLGYLFQATNNTEYADMVERCIYNAGLGAVNEDFTAIQYFSGLNQVIADDYSNHNWYYRGDSWMAYRPNHITPCCTGNSNRFFPNFVSRFYYEACDGVASVYFGESQFSLDKNGNLINIKQTTNYPFGESIAYEIEAKQAFKFYVRIPSFCNNYSVKVNNMQENYKNENGFIVIEVKSGKTNIDIAMPSMVQIKKFKDGVYVEKGCILYALNPKTTVAESQVSNGIVSEYKMWNMVATDFNYAIDTTVTPKLINIETQEFQFSKSGVKQKIIVTATKVENWKMRTLTSCKSSKNPEKKNEIAKKGKFVFTPKFPKVCKFAGQAEQIELVPFAVAKMRISIFPKFK